MPLVLQRLTEQQLHHRLVVHHQDSHSMHIFGIDRRKLQGILAGVSQMPSVTVHLDEETARRLREEAQRAGMLLSRYLALRLRRQVAWSEEVKALAGAWPDFPDPEGVAFSPAAAPAASGIPSHQADDFCR